MDKGQEISGAVGHMKKSGALWIVIFAFAAGVIMLIIGGVFGKESADEGEQMSATYDKAEFEAYKSALTSGISEFCRGVCGDGVRVLLHFETSGEVIYAQNSSTGYDGGRREEYVIVGSGSDEHPVYLGERFPPLSGLGIICPSGTTEAQKDMICAALASTYGLSLTRIYVI